MKNIILLIVLLFLLILRTMGQESKGDLFEGLTKAITTEQVIPAYGIEVTYDKTVHIIFPSAIKYVDLGSPNLIAGKAGNIENVLRIKAAVRNFQAETNFSVITSEGTFYSFNARYVDRPEKLNIEMKDLVYTLEDEDKNRSANSLNIYRKDLGEKSSRLVQLITKTIYSQNKRKIKHIGARAFGVECLLKGIYTHEDLLYFHTSIKNTSNISYEIDFIRFKIVDKRVMKRVAIQETSVIPIETFNQVTSVEGCKNERMVFVFEKFTIPDDKQLLVEIFEKNGGRNYSFRINNSDLVLADGVEKLKLEK